MSEQRENSGVLFKNDDKAKPDANKNWPDYKGWGRVAGVDVWLSAWIKEGKTGKFMSLAFKPKDENTHYPKKETQKQTADIDSDNPF